MESSIDDISDMVRSFNLDIFNKNKQRQNEIIK